jgi:hypothetical protein
VAVQAGVAGEVKSRERRSPALVEDRAVEAFDVSVGLRASGAGPGLAGAERGDRVVEALGAELVAVVGQHAFQLPADLGELAGDAPGQRIVCSACGPVVGARTRSTQA